MSKKTQLKGRVCGFNLSPKGDIEGVLVETKDGLAQVNLDKGQSLPETWNEGARFDAAVECEPKHRAHPVYRLSHTVEGASGRVARINYARHGEPNGFVLEDGTFIHLKPDGAKRFAATKVGDRIRANGLSRVGSQARVVDAHEIERS